MKIKSALCLFICLFANPLFAYKQDLHMYMTEYAVSNSVISGSDIWSLWGINSTNKFEYRQIENKFHMGAPIQLNYVELFKYGADAEDEGQDITHLLKSRAVNHFFNPQANKPIFLPGIDNYTSPDWILEGTTLGLSGEIAGQNYSYSDAQHHFYLAFTSREEKDRNFSMGLMFQTLGHIVHHIQDMAQPEHTRGDPHCDHPRCMYWISISGLEEGDDTSLYEEFTAELLACNAIANQPFSTSRVSCANLRSYNGVFQAEKIYLGGYPAPIFTNPRHYWTSPDRKGLADFSSENFISTDRAYQIASGTGSLLERLRPYSSELPYPDGNPSNTVLSEVSAATVLSYDGGALYEKYKNSKVRFIGINSLDYNTNETIDNSKMATFSIFTERYLLKPVGRVATHKGLFSVNHTNLQQRAKILLPRAVGYTTGLVNYFFRYRFIVDPKSDGIFNVKNDSNLHFKGEIHFYYDDQNGKRISLTNRSASLLPGESMEFNAKEFGDLPNRSSKFYAVAVHKTNISSKPYAAVAAVRFEYPLYESSVCDDAGSSAWATHPASTGFRNGDYQTEVNLGKNSGWVDLHFTNSVYGVAQGTGLATIEKSNGDQLECSLPQGNSEIPSYGGRRYWFYYNPDEFSDRKIIIRYKEAPIPVGRWNLFLSCPFYPIEDSMHPSKVQKLSCTNLK